MANFDTLSKEQQQKYIEYLSSKYINAQKAAEIVDFVKRTNSQLSFNRFMSNPLGGLLIVALYFSIIVYLIFVKFSEYAQFIEELNTNGVEYLLHDPIPAQTSRLLLCTYSERVEEW